MNLYYQIKELKNDKHRPDSQWHQKRKPCHHRQWSKADAAAADLALLLPFCIKQKPN